MGDKECLTLKNIVESKAFDRVIIILILLNSVALGLETYSISYGYILEIFNIFCTCVFTIEIVLKIAVYKKDAFKNGWILFDIIVVGLSVVLELIFFSGARAVQALRSFRVLRTIRLVPRAKELRNITRSIMLALPGIGWTVCLLFIVRPSPILCKPSKMV